MPDLVTFKSAFHPLHETETPVHLAICSKDKKPGIGFVILCLVQFCLGWTCSRYPV